MPFIYAWELNDEAESDHHAGAVCAVAERLYQLGRGADMAWAWGEVIDEEECEERLSNYAGIVYRPTPAGSGMTLACPAAGSLKSLTERYKGNVRRFKAEGKSRASKQLFSQPPKPLFVQVAYDSPPSRLVYELRLANSESSLGTWPLSRTSGLVVRLREGAVGRLRQAMPGRHAEIERVFVGRKANGADDGPASARVGSFPCQRSGIRMPLPGFDGCWSRFLPGAPFADDVHWSFSGLEIVSAEHAQAELLVVTPADDRGMLRHYGLGERKSRVRRTVTPVALHEAARRGRIDPGRALAEAKNGAERAAEQAATAGAVVSALRLAEVHARAELIRVQREPFSAKGERVEDFASGTRFAKERLWHVEITFAVPVSGSIVIGDGRFLGLGLFAPVGQD